MARDTDKKERDPVEREIMLTIRAFSEAFASRDAEAFAGLWDDGPIVYQPEEYAEPIVGMQALSEYFAHVPSVVRAIRDVRLLESRVQVLSADAAMVYLRFWCRLAFEKVPEVRDGQVRQSYVLRRRENCWKLVHYHESRQSPGFEEVVGTW